jgi:hypothetical protein
MMEQSQNFGKNYLQTDSARMKCGKEIFDVISNSKQVHDIRTCCCKHVQTGFFVKTIKYFPKAQTNEGDFFFFLLEYFVTPCKNYIYKILKALHV